MTRMLFLTLALGCLMTQPVSAEPSSTDHECSLSFQAKTIDGENVDLHDYEGKVVLIVNVASQCGLTRQYAGLQSLYEKYQDQGLVILGFPCNEFGGQEPGTEAEIKQFCSTKYDVTFPMMSKVNVNQDACDLYQHLTSQEAKPAGSGPISWNFEKFLIGRDGQLVHRFSPRTAPSDEELVSAIEAQLAAKS